MSDKVCQVRTFEVLTTTAVPSRRTPRHWSDEEKARLVAEAFSPGGTVAGVARSYDLDVSQLYAWRRKALSSGAITPLAVPLSIALARALIRNGARGRFYNVVDLVNRLETEARNGKQGRLGSKASRHQVMSLQSGAFALDLAGRRGEEARGQKLSSAAHFPLRPIVSFAAGLCLIKFVHTT